MYVLGLVTTAGQAPIAVAALPDRAGEIIAGRYRLDSLIGRGSMADVYRAVDTKTGKIYLPAASYGPPPAAGGRPAMLPGTFHLLVVSPSA